MAEPDRRVCECGHKAYDHLGAGRCDEGTHRCRCMSFRECPHAETVPWRGLTLCTVCRNVLERL